MAEFKEHHVVNDVIDTWPSHVTTVHYDTKHNVHLGNELTFAATQKQPKISFPTEKLNYYTVLMLDPDAPSRQNPEFRCYLHWLVVNVPHSDHVDPHQGHTISPYMGPAPPTGSGLHRYVFLVYNQGTNVPMDTTKLDTISDGNARKNFDLNNFLKTTLENKATLLSGNFFQCKRD